MTDEPDWEFKRRDVLVLRELSRDPQLSSRELSRLLEEKYDIAVSHITVSESRRGMREQGVFREAVVPMRRSDSRVHQQWSDITEFPTRGPASPDNV